MSHVASDEKAGTETATQVDTPSVPARRGPRLVVVLLGIGVCAFILAILVAVTLIAAASG